MALRVVRTSGMGLVGEATRDAVREALALCGGSTLLVPSFAQALEAQRSLADLGLSLGVRVTTPETWATESWELWGGGERLAPPAASTVVMCETIESAGKDPLPGLVRLLCRLARCALPWLPLRSDGSVDEAAAPFVLSPAEVDAIALVGAYRDRLHAHRLLERCEIMAAVPEALARSGVAVAPMVLAGFETLTKAQRELVAGLAAVTDVTVVIGGVGSPRVEDALVKALADVAAAHGVRFGADPVPPTAHTVREAGELSTLQGMLTTDVAAGELGSAGEVIMLEAAGPMAEAELVARELVAAAEAGASSVLVVAPDAARMWRELAPKLVARGVSATAQLSVPFLELEAGRAFVAYARAVARLASLATTWPADEEGLRRLGDMSWWPPRDLSDFLLSGISRVSRDKAARLDAAWRSNRLLSPADVLAALLSAKLTSEPVERATRELLKGRLGSAASRLMASRVVDVDGCTAADSGFAMEAMTVLGAVLDVSGSLRELGVSADPKADDAVALEALIDRALVALGATSVTLRPALELPGARCSVHMVSPTQAALLPPRSVDVVCVCGLSSDEWPLGGDEDLGEELLAELGIETIVDKVGLARAGFARIVGLARSRLLLERALFTAASHERYPSPLLEELRVRYARDELPVRGRGEAPASASLSARGMASRRIGFETRHPVGSVSAKARGLVTVVPEGVPARPDSLPLLSASQIESYLECPLKWFSLRRLRLQDADATCGPPEMGTFVHRVLEVTRRRMLMEGLDELAISDQRRASVLALLAGIADDKAAASMGALPSVADVIGAFSQRVARSRVTVGDEAALAHAKELLAAEFDEHLVHQYLLEGGHARYQALVAHNEQEQSAIARLRRDLLSLLDYEASRLVGFEPRLFEWDFGGKRHPVAYAGASIVGTVDRLDVNAHGQALVIDYKHKGANGFASEHAAFGRDGLNRDTPFTLPRHVQALIYAQVARRAFPGLSVVGALYLGTKGDHALAGAVSANQAGLVLGDDATKAELALSSMPDDVAVADAEGTGMASLLDATEAAIASRIEDLRSGHIEARPIDAAACRFCPVLGCERRLG